MIKSYNLKIYANKGKLMKINDLLNFWKNKVNEYINIFWDFNELNGTYPPKDYRNTGNRISNDASLKAWQIVKGVKNRTYNLCEELMKLNPNTKDYDKLKNKIDKIYRKPIFKGNEIDLNDNTIKFSNYKNSYDFWFRLSCLDKGKRLKIPCKTYKKFNDILKQGILKKSGKIFKDNKNRYYLTVFVEIPNKIQNANNYVGLDSGMNNPIVTSDGIFYGQDLKNLRIRTKWRKYGNGISAYKQGLNKITKEIISDYNNYNFVVESLLFQGKYKRTKKFRRNNKNWSYNHLINKLEELGKTKGFKVIQVNPHYTSLTCPNCEHVDKLNRKNDSFKCIKCNFQLHADVVGAINILRKSKQGFSVPLNLSE